MAASDESGRRSYIWLSDIGKADNVQCGGRPTRTPRAQSQALEATAQVAKSPSLPERQLQAIDEMPLLLLNIELDLYAEVPLSDELTALLVKQWERLQDEAAKDAFGARIGAKLGPVLADCVDWDLKPPTPAQVTFATAIARQRGLDLPGDVLRFRGAMNDFLDAHADPAKKGLAKRPPRSG